MFLVHYGVNLWILNDNLMSAYDLAAASQRDSLARFIDAAASQAFADDNNGTMRLCRRAASDAKRRLTAQCQSSDSRSNSVLGHRLRNTPQFVDGWRNKTLPDAASSSSATPVSPSSSVFVQSPRLANGELFSAATNSDTLSHDVSVDSRKRRRFWPRSARRTVGHGTGGTGCVQPLRAAATARQLLLMSIHDDSLLHDAQSRVVTERLRLLSVHDNSLLHDAQSRVVTERLLLTSVHDDSLLRDAQSRVVTERLRLLSLTDSCCMTTDEQNNLTPRYRVNSQFYCQSRVSDDVSAVRSSSEVVDDQTRASTQLPYALWPSVSQDASKHDKTSRRHRQTADVSSETSRHRTRNNSDVYCLPADYIRRHRVKNHNQPSRHGSGSTSHHSSRLSSKSRLTETSDSGDDRLRHWLVNHGLAEYWTLLATEKVDLDTLTLLDDDDLRQLGVPLGPRRRMQHIIRQMQCQSQSGPVATTANGSTVDDTQL